MMQRFLPTIATFLACLCSAIASGCASQPAGPRLESERADRRASEPTPPTAAADAVLGYVNGEAVTLGTMRRPLLEAAGGQTLAEIVLDRLLEERLARAGLTLTPERIEAERTLLVQTLDADDEDRATLLLQQLRRRRGLGGQRFNDLLRRNAAMRMLVEGQIDVTPAAVQRAYRLAYGERYRARVISVPTAGEANRLRERLIAGEAEFADLAAEHSTDASAPQGGLLPPISPADPAFPAPVRDALAKLDARGESLSDVVALDNGYALLRLERKVTPEAVEFADVEDELAEQVRRSTERALMQQLARELLTEANVVVLDPTLAESWRTQREAVLGP